MKETNKVLWENNGVVCNRIYVNREVKTFKWEPKKEKELVKHRKRKRTEKVNICPKALTSLRN